MFGGLIKSTGKVRLISPIGGGKNIDIELDKQLNLNIGDSIAINGACQTITAISSKVISFFSSKHTCNLTNLGNLHTGNRVNIELPLTLSDRIDGHILLGHIDEKKPIKYIKQYRNTRIIAIPYSKEFTKFVIKNGSIAIDGISLTITDVKPAYFELTIIPHTLSHTNLIYRKAGDIVNIEYDYIAKIVSNIVK